MRYVYTLAFVCLVAFGCTAQDEVNKVGPTPDEVDQQSLYDVGIKVHDPEAKPLAVEVPEGKADKIVVLGATWCLPCQSYKATTSTLKLQGYKVEYFDVDDDLDKLFEKYSNIKRRPGNEVNHWTSIPTTFYIRGDTIIKKEVGYKTVLHVKKTLWKPDEPTVGPVIKKVDEVRKNLPWNR